MISRKVAIGAAAIILALVGIDLAMRVVGWDRKYAPPDLSDVRGAAPAAAKPADPKREKAFQTAVALAKIVKATANDPESIEVFNAFYTEDGTVAIEYRGRNAFNAKIINRAVYASNGKAAAGADKDVAPLWNKFVANKAGIDLTEDLRIAHVMRLY